MLVEGHGRPLAVVIGGANTPDAQLLKATLEALVVERPAPSEAAPQHLCLDKGYDNAPAEAVVTHAGYVPHIRRIGQEKLDEQGQKKHPARRWVVERTFAWLSRCRAILVRYDKPLPNTLPHNQPNTSLRADDGGRRQNAVRQTSGVPAVLWHPPDAVWRYAGNLESYPEKAWSALLHPWFGNSSQGEA